MTAAAMFDYFKQQFGFSVPQARRARFDALQIL
jgi:hypothetical protein